MQKPLASRSSRQTFRIDLQHQVLDLMERAVARISSGAIQVRLADDEVILDGHVNTWHEKQYAQESIRSLTSGRVIRNSLVVSR